MFQTDQSTAVSSLPTPATAGTPGFFTGGNPGAGQPATIVDNDWLNMIQTELINVVEAAGETPSKTTYNQVLAAITQMFNPGRFLGIQTFVASGTYTPGTYTVGGRSVTATKYRARLWSPGGGGQGSPSSSAAGNSGSGGGYTEGVGVASVQAVTIGAPGTAGAAGTSTVGTAGGTSSFGGLSATGGAGSASPAGGVGSGGYFNVAGQRGQGAPSTTIGGSGGAVFGSWGGQSHTTSVADAGGFPGGGGGGGGSGFGGGVGGASVLIIEEFA